MPEDTNTLTARDEQQWKEWHDLSAIERVVAPIPGSATPPSFAPLFTKHLASAFASSPPAGYGKSLYGDAGTTVPCVVLSLNHARVILYITQHLAEVGGAATIIATAVGDNDTVLAGCLFCPASEVLGRELLEVEKVRNLAMQTAELWQKQYGGVKRHT